MSNGTNKSILWKVLGVYAAASWVVLQVVDVLADNVGLPPWVFTFALILLVIGLPVVGATAYLHGLGAGAPSDRTVAPEAAAGGSRGLFTWRNVVLGSMAGFALWGIVAAGWLVFGGVRSDSAASGQETGTASDGAALAGSAEGPEGRISIVTASAGVGVRMRRVIDVEELALGDPVEIGDTPIEVRSIPAGDYLVEMSAEGSNALVRLVSVGAEERVDISAELVPDVPLTRDMVLVPAGSAPVGVGGMPTSAFLADRHEVTNEEYARFVGDQGYTTATLWPDSASADGAWVQWVEAATRLTDESGVPGPRGWSGSLYPSGTGDHPVTGVSWYEANAYCLWAGKRLPTAVQWWRAALGDGERAFPWGDAADAIESRAAFDGEGARPVESLPLGLSPFGLYEMAGNVREWLQTDAEAAQTASSVGGSWQSPVYTFGIEWQEALPLGFANETTGFRCVRHTE